MDTTRRCQARACGAQGYWTTWIDATEMDWCNHHFKEYETRLREVSMAIIDRTWELEP